MLFVRPHFRFDARTPEVRKRRSRPLVLGRDRSTQRFVYRDVLWAALLINLFALAFPMFSMNVYDRVVPNNAVETLWALAIGVLLVLCADLFMRLLRSHFVDEASARIDVQISATLMETRARHAARAPARVGGLVRRQPARLRAGARLHRLEHRHRADRPAVRAAVRRA